MTCEVPACELVSRPLVPVVRLNLMFVSSSFYSPLYYDIVQFQFLKK